MNLIKGIKKHTKETSVILSMADEGGSSGRLRRLFNVFPPGDLISCMAAFYQGKHSFLPNMLTYRFPGDRYGKEMALSGHKLGNLMMVPLIKNSSSFEEAIKKFQDLFGIDGAFIPATDEHVRISAITADGQEVIGEEAIDLGKYNGKRILEQVILHPKNVKAPKKAVEAIHKADLIVAGPGDLYTTILPVLIVEDIKKALASSKAKRVFVVNVANKPFETKGYDAFDYVKAVMNHLGSFPFDTVILNSNYTIRIPSVYHYTYVRCRDAKVFKENGLRLIEKDLVDRLFPLYHDCKKLANALIQEV